MESVAVGEQRSNKTGYLNTRKRKGKGETVERKRKASTDWISKENSCGIS